MPRSRTPNRLHVLRGSYRPDRHGVPDATLPAGDLGDPPETWAELSRTTWAEIAGAAPHLTRSDRLMVELLCRAVVAIRTTSARPALLAQAARLCDSLGIGPKGRQALEARAWPEQPAADNELDELLD